MAHAPANRSRVSLVPSRWSCLLQTVRVSSSRLAGNREEVPRRSAMRRRPTYPCLLAMLLLMFGSTQTSRAEPILVTTVQVPGVLRFGHSQATPFVTATVTYQTDGFHLYQYVLSNPQPSDMPLAILQLDGLFGIPADHTQP